MTLGGRQQAAGNDGWGPPQPFIFRPLRDAEADYRRIVQISFEHGAIEGHLSGVRGDLGQDLKRHRDAIIRYNLERLRDAFRAGVFVAEDAAKGIVGAGPGR